MTAWLIFVAWVMSLGDGASMTVTVLCFCAWINEIY
jgi:hypothetical protein